MADSVALISSPTVRAGGSAVCVYAQDGVGVMMTARHIYLHSTGQRLDMATYRADTVITFPGGQKYMATQATTHPATNRNPPTTDLAAVVFRYDGAPPKVVEVATAYPEIGAEVWQIGFPAVTQGRQDVQYGKVIRGEPGMVRASVLIRSGNSGGGLFDKQGRLVGITVTSDTFDPRQYCNAVGTSTCRAFYENTCLPLVGRRPRQPQPVPPSVEPVAPPAMPPAGGVSPPPTTTSPDAAILSQILARLEAIEKAGGKPGPQGPAGPPGASGARGEAGPVGPQGLPADEARVKALEDVVAALKAQRIKVELIGPDGAVIKTDSFGADRPLRLQIVPLK